MERVGSRELRADLAHLISRAGSGERIIVTVGGEPVAQLGPIESTSSKVTLDELIARGLVTAPRRDDRPSPSMSMPTWTGTRLDNVLREVRGR